MSEHPENACLTHRPPKPDKPWRLADPGYRTCSSCYDRIHGLLSPLTMDKDERPDSIPGLYELLDPTPGHSESGRRGPGFAPRSPASDHIIVMTDHRSRAMLIGRDYDPETDGLTWPRSVPGGLYAIAADLKNRRGLTEPLPGTVTALSLLIDAHLDWLTRQDDIDDVHSDLRELHRQLKTAAGSPRRFIGLCPNTIDEGEHTRACGARLFAPLYGDTIECWACGRPWTRHEWMRLGDLLEAS